MHSGLHAWPEVPELARGRLRFSPPIEGFASNEWWLLGVSAEEALVRNCASREELGIPRRWIDGVARWEDPVRVVALRKRLEYEAGTLRPGDRAVIEMPLAADGPRVRSAQPAHVIAMGDPVEPPPRWKHYLRISVALGCLACIVAVYVFREGRSTRVRRYLPRPSRLVPHSPALTLPIPLERR